MPHAWRSDLESDLEESIQELTANSECQNRDICVVGIVEVDSLVHLHEEHLTYDHKTSDADCDADQEAHELMSNEANSMEEPALSADLELHFPDDSDTDDSDFEREQDQVECPDHNQKDEIGRFYTTDD